MENSGDGSTGENIRDFPARRSRRQSRHGIAMGQVTKHPTRQHHQTHQRSGRAPDGKGSRVKALVNLLWWVLVALWLGTFFRLIYAAFMFWGPV